jgi:hypothetical protein
MDDVSLPSVLCAELAMFPLSIFRRSFIEENCFIIVYDTVRNYGTINPLKDELNPICHLLALLVAHHILHVSRIRVKNVSGSNFVAQNVEILGNF